MTRIRGWQIVLALVCTAALLGWWFGGTQGLLSSFSGDQEQENAVAFIEPAMEAEADPALEEFVAVLDLRQSAAHPGHALNDRAVCPAVEARAVNGAERYAVFSWQDENGRTHYSDKPPADKSPAVDGQLAGEVMFSLKLERRSAELPADMESQLHAAGKAMYDFYAAALGKQLLKQAQITLLVFGRGNEFESYLQQNAPGMDRASGFYQLAENRAVVNYTRSDSVTRAIALHEMSHLVTTNHLGPVPTWLAEGISEYFEDMEAGSESATIKPRALRKKLIAQRAENGRFKKLDYYLSAKTSQFYGEDTQQHFAASWALVHMLMSDSWGQKTLRSLLKETRKNFCKRFETKTRLYQLYPGGYSRLNRDWDNWLRQMPRSDT